MSKRDRLSQSRRWVVKIGSALLTSGGRGLDHSRMAAWVDQMVALAEGGASWSSCRPGRLPRA